MVVGRKHSHKDHDLAFTTLLQTARKCHVKLSFEKLQYNCMEVNFYGETYTTDGHKPAQSKITTIVEMHPPAPKTGTIIYGYDKLFVKILPRLTELAKPIRELVKEKVPFKWGLQHQELFTMLKKEIVRAPILAYYNP